MRKRSAYLSLGHLFAFATVVILLWLANLMVVPIFFDGPNQGLFGDMFGAVNALFSGLALAGLVYAIFLQREEIRLAKEDATRTKEMLRDQTTHLEEQNKRAEKKSFEDVFFGLLSSLTGIASGFSYKEAHTAQIMGKNVFSYFVQSANNKFSHLKPIAEPKKNVSDLVSSLRGHYKELYRDQWYFLSAYLQTLATILDYLDKTEIDDKQLYGDILIAQFDQFELVIIFYHGLSEEAHPTFKKKVEQFSLLKNLNRSLLVNSDLVKGYNREAFG